MGGNVSSDTPQKEKQSEMETLHQHLRHQEFNSEQAAALLVLHLEITRCCKRIGASKEGILLCPISLEPIRTPAVSSGTIFELENLQKWVKVKKRPPGTSDEDSPVVVKRLKEGFPIPAREPVRTPAVSSGTIFELENFQKWVEVEKRQIVEKLIRLDDSDESKKIVSTPLDEAVNSIIECFQSWLSVLERNNENSPLAADFQRRTGQPLERMRASVAACLAYWAGVKGSISNPIKKTELWFECKSLEITSCHLPQIDEYRAQSVNEERKIWQEINHLSHKSVGEYVDQTTSSLTAGNVSASFSGLKLLSTYLPQITASLQNSAVMNNLAIFDVSGCALEDGLAVELCAKLRHLPNLLLVDFRGNDLGDLFGIDLNANLKVPSYYPLLTVFRLEDNPALPMEHILNVKNTH